MDSKQMVQQLQTKLGDNFTYTFDEKYDKLRREHKTLQKGMDILIGDLVAKCEQKKEAAINEVIYTVEQTFLAMEKEAASGFGGLTNVYPVVRSTSFPKASKLPSPTVPRSSWKVPISSWSVRPPLKSVVTAHPNPTRAKVSGMSMNVSFSKKASLWVNPR